MRLRDVALVSFAGAGLVMNVAMAQTLGELKNQLDELKNRLDLQAKDSVVAGDVPGSFRLPGSETSLRIYGYVEAHWLKDFGTSAPGDDFSNIGEQPTNKNALKGRSRMTAQASRLGFDSSTPTSFGPFATKIETDFYSYCNNAGNANDCNRNRLRLRHAYGEYAGFLVGQTWSPWMDIDNSPETVDFNGPVGGPFARNPMIRYTYNVPDIAKFIVALEDPHAWGGASIKNDRGQKLPNIVLRAGHDFSWGNITARYLLSNATYSNDANQHQTKYGNSFGIGGSWKITDADLVMAQFNSVRGDYNWAYLVGANGQLYDANTNTLYNDKSIGFLVGYTHTFNDKWRSTVAYSQNNAREDGVYVDAYGSRTANKKLIQYHINTIYTPIKNLDLGLEYLGGSRKTYSGDTGNMSRLDFMARYSF